MSDDPAVERIERLFRVRFGWLRPATRRALARDVVEAVRPIIEAEYQNRMVELTKAPITAADLSELAINDLTDAERDAFVAALTEGRTSEDRAARAARVRAKILGEDAQSEGGTSWSSPEADPLGDMAAYAEEQKQLELRRLTGEPELDDQVAITGQYPPTGDTVWPPADNGEPDVAAMIDAERFRDRDAE